MQVDALQSWQDSTAQAGPDQVAATQHAVSWLREAGHSEADTLCVKYLRAAGIEVGWPGVGSLAPVLHGACKGVWTCHGKLRGRARQAHVDPTSRTVCSLNELPVVYTYAFR